MSSDFRIEADSMGQMQVPSDAYYGAQTARAVENFPISRLRFHRPMIKALGLLKKAAAATNVELGKLDPALGDAIQRAAQEVVDGKWDHQFVVDIFQTGSGTSTNMNTNEIIANRAIELNGGRLGDKSIHPNDHVNLGQSSNDIIPSAIHLAALDAIVHELIPALNQLYDSLLSKSRDFSSVLKIGRTHLQDATPMTLGQEFSGYARQVQLGIDRLWAVEERLGGLALGGTAVGTGINTHPQFASRTIQKIGDETGLNIREAQNHFEAQGARDACVETSGALRTIAASLIKIANDIRFLASGPRCGIGELKMKATQPGSSIMPGKVNPVMSEMLIMVGAQVMGNDATIAFSGAYGNFELNVMLPVIAHNLLESIEILASSSRVFALRAIKDLQADKERCEGLIEESLAMCTSLAPVIGYDNAAAIAKKAYESGRTIRQVALAESGLTEAQLNQLLDPLSQTQPQE
ncbi:MAG: class II fumarate hydratase [Verrucomicrobia bacterium]|nr:class II fumarate hydratase [Verrucomicrobiota bacterium]